MCPGTPVSEVEAECGGPWVDARVSLAPLREGRQTAGPNAHVCVRPFALLYWEGDAVSMHHATLGLQAADPRLAPAWAPHPAALAASVAHAHTRQEAEIVRRQAEAEAVRRQNEGGVAERSARQLVDKDARDAMRREMQNLSLIHI